MGLREKWLKLHDTDALLTIGAEDALQRLEVREYVLGEHLYEVGDASHELYLILSGSVMEYLECADGTQTIAELRATDFLGEEGCLRGVARSANAIVTETCRVLVVPERDVDQTISNLPRWFISLIESLMVRLQAADARLTAACRLSIDDR
jgi:CRP-like cAMP-binding protein